MSDLLSTVARGLRHKATSIISKSSNSSKRSSLMDPIASAVDLCQKAFEEARKNLRTDEDSSSANGKIKHEINRFQSWSQHSGAHKINKNSLDEKLRDATQLRDVVLDCLEHLARLLVVLSHLVSSSLHKQDSNHNERIDGSVQFTRGSIEISDAELLGEEPLMLTTKDRMEMLCTDISHTITNLLKLSVTFHNPVPIDRYRKAAKVDIYDFEKRDREYVELAFPKLSPILRERLVQSILSRRRFLQYCKDHHLELSGGFVLNVETNDGPEGRFEISEDHSETTASRLPDIDDFDDPEAPERYVDTKAEDPRSVTSYASNTNDSSRPRLPAPPDEFGVEPFPCPYCYLYISPNTTQEWRDHVVSDLQPYICTFEDCGSPDELYGSRNKWFEHEQVHHRQSLACIKNNCPAIFSTLRDLEAHLAQEHKEVYPSLLQSAIARWSSRKLPEEYAATCPFCGDEIKSPKLVRRHIGDHQLQSTLWVSRYYWTRDGDDDEEDDIDIAPTEVIETIIGPRGNDGTSQIEKLRHIDVTNTNSGGKTWFFTKRLLDVNAPVKVVGSLIAAPLNLERVLVPPITDVISLNTSGTSYYTHTLSSSSMSLGTSVTMNFKCEVEIAKSKEDMLLADKLTYIIFSPTKEYISELVELLPASTRSPFLIPKKYYVITGVMVGKGIKLTSTRRRIIGTRVLFSSSISQALSQEGSSFHGDGIIGYRLSEVRIQALGGRINVKSYQKGATMIKEIKHQPTEIILRRQKYKQ